MRHHTMKLFALAAIASLNAGCLADAEVDSQEGALSTGRSEIVHGTPEAVGVLGFLNDADTDFYVLDEMVPLDKRAAENLIAHRNGADGVYGTADDDAFDHIDEVDAVSYVGEVALSRLLAYAEAHGYVPEGEDVLGVYDYVAFTVNEAAATLALVNSASAATLDDDVGLDKRAVEIIIADGSIDSMLELEAVKYIGQAAMLKLRAYPKTQTPAEPPAPGNIPNGSECTSHDGCLSGVCAGMTVFDGNGWCISPSMMGTFESTADHAVPSAGSVQSNIQVSGLASVPLDVLVTLDIDHPRKQDLVVALHQPGGGYEVLWDHDANPPATVSAGWGIERDNMVNGTWTLEVIDTATGQSGTLQGWSMWLTSNYD